jgi:hypothetical protein
MHILIKNRKAQVILFLLLILTVWWFLVSPFDPEGASDHSRYVWGAFYQMVALIGGLFGLISARSWGGFKSVMGRSIIAFSVGLLLQSFGQSVYSFYNLYLKVEAPYPSLGDIGFFGSIPAYIYGVLLLARASGVKVSLRTFSNQIQAVLLPLVLLGLSYLVFLRNYEIDWSLPLQVFLDFGYPFGQAIYVSLAILTFLLSRKVLGGMMKIPILFVLVALVLQYLSDYNFLYQFSKETWHVAGYGDYLYLLSYFLMSISLIQLGLVHQIVRNGSK